MKKIFSRNTVTSQTLEQQAADIRVTISSALKQAERVNVLYHRKCSDGVTAAAIVKNSIDHNRSEIEATLDFTPVNYGDDIVTMVNNCTDECDRKKTVLLFVDFCPKPEQLQVLTRSYFVIIIDHHQSSIAAFDAWYIDRDDQTKSFIVAVFDDANTMSGAMMTWWLFDNTFKRENIQRVDRYDRFDKAVDWENTKTVSSYLKSIISNATTPMEEIVAIGDIMDSPAGFVLESASDYYEQYKLLIGGFANSAITASRAFYDGSNVQRGCLFTADKSTISDIAAQIFADNPEVKFAIGMFALNNVFEMSVRSTPDSPIHAVDMAEAFGGGGHRSAAGFKVTPMELGGVIAKLIGMWYNVNNASVEQLLAQADSQNDCGVSVCGVTGVTGIVPVGSDNPCSAAAGGDCGCGCGGTAAPVVSTSTAGCGC